LLFEPRWHELKLRHWAIHFHSEIIMELIEASDRKETDFYCKYFELRPYTYAIN